MNDTLKRIIGIALILTPVIAYLYVWYLSIVLFLIPAFQTYFALYGVWQTFAIWFGLTAAGFICGLFFPFIYSNFKEGFRHEHS